MPVTGSGCPNQITRSSAPNLDCNQRGWELPFRGRQNKRLPVGVHCLQRTLISTYRVLVVHVDTWHRVEYLDLYGNLLEALLSPSSACAARPISISRRQKRNGQRAIHNNGVFAPQKPLVPLIRPCPSLAWSAARPRTSYFDVARSHSAYTLLRSYTVEGKATRTINHKTAASGRVAIRNGPANAHSIALAPCATPTRASPSVSEVRNDCKRVSTQVQYRVHTRAVLSFTAVRTNRPSTISCLCSPLCVPVRLYLRHGLWRRTGQASSDQIMT
jgi:hypothetical protein